MRARITVTAQSADGSNIRQHLQAKGSRRAVLAAALGAFAAAACAPSGGGPTATPSTQPAPTDHSPSPGKGIAELPAAEILGLGIAALARAKSYQVDGFVVADGRRFRYQVRTMGQNYVQGQFTGEGLTMELLRQGDHFYMRAPEAYWRLFAPNQNIPFEQIDGKWVRFPADSPAVAQVAAIGDPRLTFKATRAQAKGRIQTFAGQEAITVDTNEGIFTISTDRINPVILQVMNDDTCGGDFTAFNTSFLTFPPPDSFIDAQEFLGSG
jgi:hypothetical protein